REEPRRDAGAVGEQLEWNQRAVVVRRRCGQQRRLDVLALEREEAQASGLGVHGIYRVREQPGCEQVRELARTVALAAERTDEPALPVADTDLLVLPLRHVDVALRTDREPAHVRERGLRVVRAADAELLDERPPLPRSVFG